MNNQFEKIPKWKLEKCIKNYKTSKCFYIFLYISHENTFIYALRKSQKGKWQYKNWRKDIA